MNKDSWSMFKKNQPIPIDQKAKMILDPSAFDSYIKGLNLEPIEQVKKRYELIKPVEQVPQYVNSGQMAKDVTRLEMETGKVKNKNQPGKFLVNQDPVFVRKMYKPENVIEFYEKDLKGVGKNASIEVFNNRMATLTMISDIKHELKVRGYTKYAAILDEVSWFLDEQPRDRVSDRLYKLSYKLPKDRCADQIKRLKVLAAELNDSSCRTASIDPYAAVLVAHINSSKDKFEMMHLTKAAEEIKKQDQNHTLSPDSIKEILMRHHLVLRSSSPEALNILHHNFMKITGK